MDSDPLTDAIWLDMLACGSNYSIYMTAYNHVGASLPSTIVSANTKGRGKTNKTHSAQIYDDISLLLEAIMLFGM